MHQHWLRQEVQHGRIAVKWVKTADMVADGMTKALPRVKHIEFLKQLRMEDIRLLIASEALLEDAKDKAIAQLHMRFPPDQTLRLGYKGS